MANSSLVNYTRISPNSNNPRKYPITKITIHHAAAVASVEGLGSVFANASRQASANYGIGSDGRVGLYVDEANRAWTSSNRDNDERAVTIEVSNSAKGGDWLVSDLVLAKLIDLVTDICQRNGIEKLNYTGDASGNLTRHNMFAATACPGKYLQSKFPYIAEEVNKRLTKKEAKVMYHIQICDTDKANAEKMLSMLKKAGYNAVIKEEAIEEVKEPVKETVKEPVKELKVGSLVRLNQGAKTYTGGSLKSFVYNRNHTVKSISGDRVVITFNGVTVAAVRKEDLTLV